MQGEHTRCINNWDIEYTSGHKKKSEKASLTEGCPKSMVVMDWPTGVETFSCEISSHGCLSLTLTQFMWSWENYMEIIVGRKSW